MRQFKRTDVIVKRVYSGLFFFSLSVSKFQKTYCLYCLSSLRYLKFISESSQTSSTFNFWTSYIEMVKLLLLFIRATRSSDWKLHLSALRSMLPWYFGYDRVNYARYACVYWLEMSTIEISHPGNVLFQ